MSKHFNQLNIVGLILLFFVGCKASAQSYQLNGDYYIRSSMDFFSLTNKIGILHEGSTFRVVNRFPKSNGAEALEIEVTAMSPKSYVNPPESGRIYIYKPVRSSDFIPRSYQANEQAGVAKCENCEQPTSPSNIVSLAQITDEVYKMANTVPQMSEPTEKIAVEPTNSADTHTTRNLDAQIKAYSESKEVTRMIDWAMKNKSASSKGMCYRKVKEAMATQCGPPREDYFCRNPFAPEGGKKGPGNNLTKSVSTEMADSYALSAKTRLKQEGFVNLLEIEPYKTQMHSPKNAPKGAILVYSSGIPCKKQKDCGHTEIKVGNPGEPGYVSDYYSDNSVNETPRTRKYPSNYKLVGVMIKPKD